MSGIATSPSQQHTASNPPLREFERSDQDNSLSRNWLRCVSDYSERVQWRRRRLLFWGAANAVVVSFVSAPACTIRRTSSGNRLVARIHVRGTCDHDSGGSRGGVSGIYLVGLRSPSRRPKTKSPTERAGSLSAGLDWSDLLASISLSRSTSPDQSWLQERTADGSADRPDRKARKACG